MARSCHVHHTALILRRWYVGIEPLDLSEIPAPVWVLMKNVPPQLTTVKGVSWLASQLGKPINKFIREELIVKVCVYLNLDSKDVLTVLIGDKQVNIEVKYPNVRRFGNTSKKFLQTIEVEGPDQNTEFVVDEKVPRVSTEVHSHDSVSVANGTHQVTN
ncbi:hypothetical protein LINPERPRIM_LOCUS20395 [Linum perenne]